MYKQSEADQQDKRSTKEWGENQERDFIMALRHAIENDELKVDYQPRYDARTGGVLVLEALVRWQRLGAGLIYPSVFIDTAIQQGLIFDLDQWVFEQCCKDLKWFRKHIGEKIRIAINISAVECESLHHSQKLIDICDASGLSLSDFEFEITTSSAIKDARKVKAFCETMTSRGASVSLDNFGIGQSPLSSLCDFPVTHIKLDRSIVHRLESDKRYETLIQHLAALAHELGIGLIADGVENRHQYKLLRTLGCDQLQGYLICRPLSRNRILPYLVTSQTRQDSRSSAHESAPVCPSAHARAFVLVDTGRKPTKVPATADRD